jgi:hypothetical protein
MVSVRTLIRLGAITSALGVAAMTGISPASAATPNYTSVYNYTITDAATGRCLDSNYLGDIYTLPCNGGNYQRWNFIYNSSWGAYDIQDRQTGLCIATSGWYVWTEDCGGGAEHMMMPWTDNGANPDSFAIVTADDYTDCLDSNTSGATSNFHTVGSVYTSDFSTGGACGSGHDSYQDWYGHAG